MFFEFPPPITKSPFGLIARDVKCLFLVEFLAVFLSSYNLPPAISYLHSINDLILPSSVSHKNAWPPKVVDISSFLTLGWKSQVTTSDECVKVSRRPCRPKTSQTLTVISQLELASIDPLSEEANWGLKHILETGAVWLLRTSRS